MKQFAITMLKGLGWLLLALLLLVLAWLASNNRWVDARSDAVPAALQLPPVTLPAERNAYFTLIGLNAPAGEDPNKVGQQRWSDNGGTAEALPSLRWPAPKPDDPASSWNCRLGQDDCVARWREQSVALQALMQTHALIGSRCEALADTRLALEEWLPTPSAEIKEPKDQYAAKMPSFQHWTQCGRWLRIQTVLAEARGDTAALKQGLQRSQNYVQGLLTQAGSLLGNLLAWNLAAEHWQLAVALAARQPALTADMIRLLEPLPPEALDASRWMAHEAYFGRQVSREMGLTCQPGGPPMPDAEDLFGLLDRTAMCSPFGLMPRATQQLWDAFWLQGIERSRGGPLALLGWSYQPQGVRVLGMAWRNTLGHILMDVGLPTQVRYGERQADLLLSHEAAKLALQAAAYKPAERAAWLAAQPLDARLRERIRLEEGQILARPWHAEGKIYPLMRYPIPRLQDT